MLCGADVSIYLCVKESPFFLSFQVSHCVDRLTFCEALLQDHFHIRIRAELLMNLIFNFN